MAFMGFKFAHESLSVISEFSKDLGKHNEMEICSVQGL
jgi:hypothetical protein